MAQNLQICELDENVLSDLKKFRFRKEKNKAAIMLKVDKETRKVVIEDRYEDCSIEELQAELPENHPRFLVISYVLDHSDGRQSFPLCFIQSIPVGAHQDQKMMYAGSVLSVQNALGITKKYEVRDPDDFTEEWFLAQLTKT